MSVEDSFQQKLKKNPKIDEKDGLNPGENVADFKCLSL